MKVVYVSKASRVAAHRHKPAALARKVDLTLVLPDRWGREPDEPRLPSDPRTVTLPTLFHGHNHFHLYRGLGRVLDYRDMPTVRAITRDAAKANNRFSSFILSIVKSAPFQMRTVASPTAQAAGRQ